MIAVPYFLVADVYLATTEALFGNLLGFGGSDVAGWYCTKEITDLALEVEDLFPAVDAEILVLLLEWLRGCVILPAPERSGAVWLRRGRAELGAAARPRGMGRS